MRVWKSDVVPLALFAGLGGALGWWLVGETRSVFFYQMFTPEALMWACGFGFHRPRTLPPEMADFLVQRSVPAFVCATIPPDLSVGPPGFFFQMQLYLSWTAALLWRLLGPTQMAIAPVVALFVAGYAAGAYRLSRLFLGYGLACIAALVITLSPVALSQAFYLRDYAKGPFLLWGIALLVLAVRQAGLRRSCVMAAAAGAVAGIGYGFRADVAILLPLGIGFLPLASRFALRATAGLTAAYGGAFLLFALPILTLGNGGNVGTLVMQGATEPFRAFLALRPAPYALGWKYSDELTLSAVAAAERPHHPDWDAHEPAAGYGASQAITLSSADLAEWGPSFAADFATQAAKGAAWILGYPALVAVSRGNLDPGGPARLDLPLIRRLEPVYGLFGQSWMPMLGFAGVLTLLWRVAARSGREALGLGVLLLGLLAYPAIQFSVRHVFYLEFVWILALLSLLPVALEWRRLMPALPCFGLAAGAVLGAMLAAYAGLAWFQQRRLTAEFAALLAAPRQVVATVPEPEGDGSMLLRVPVPDGASAAAQGPPDSMNDGIASVGVEHSVRASGERMLLTLGGARCPAGPVRLGLRYDHRPHVWQPLDSELAVRPDDLVVFPAFYRPTQAFAGVLVPASHAGCEVHLFRLPPYERLPFVLTAVLPPDWTTLHLRKGFGRFRVTPMP